MSKKQHSFDVETMGKTRRQASHKMFKGKGPDGKIRKPMVTISKAWWDKMGRPENFKVVLVWEED